ncbi:lipopolysaccharide biosynthesis protein [Blautia hansenii]|uniref:lipopolysaccharide biosynthesis protein n=1 Tax=Blautia hansenii TaxID=1322 RepID=UPI0022E696CD|nr:oligosaccharide flippase family protein [Blautia hansenii]
MSSESRGKYLFKNTFIFTIGSIGTKLITFFLVPLYTYMLTSKEYGVVDLISTISMVLVPVLVLNINESVMRFSLDKDANYNQIMSAGLLSLFLAVVVGILIFPISGMISGIQQYAGYLYFYTISSAASQLFLCYLRGKEKLMHYACGNILNTFCVAILNIIFLVVLKAGIQGYLKAYIIANFITALYAFAVGNVKEVLKHFQLNRKLTFEMLKYSVVLIPNVFMWWIMNSADRIVVTMFLGAAANGIFAIAYKIPSLMSTVAGIFNQAWSYSAIREDNSDDIEKYTNSVYRGLFFVVSGCALGMMMVLKPFLSIYVSDEYFIAWKYAPFLIIGFVFQTLSTFLSTPYTVNKDSKGFLFSAMTGAIANIVLNILLVFKLGIYGVAFATCVSYIVVFLYRMVDTKKYVRVYVFDKKYLLVFGILFLQTMIIYLNNLVSQIVLVVLFLIGVIVQYKVWLPVWRQITSRLIKKNRGA